MDENLKIYYRGKELLMEDFENMFTEDEMERIKLRLLEKINEMNPCETNWSVTYNYETV